MVLFSIVIIPDSFSLLYSHSLPTIDHSFKVTVPVHAVSHVYVNVNSCQPSIPIYVPVFETTIILFSGSSKASEFKSQLVYLIVFLHVIFIVPVQSTLFVSGLMSMLQSNVVCVDAFSFTVISHVVFPPSLNSYVIQLNSISPSIFSSTCHGLFHVKFIISVGFVIVS
jgi:hypothetical protein